MTEPVTGDGTTGADADHDDRPCPIRPAAIPNTSIPRRDRHTWSLFEDWCTAHGEPSLAASPESLARFLHAHPAAACLDAKGVETRIGGDIACPQGRDLRVRQTCRSEREDQCVSACEQR